MQTTEQGRLATTHVMNYKTVIKQHAWLTDAKGRLWIILSLTHAWDFNKSCWCADPYQVTLLEVGAEEPVVWPYAGIVELFEKGLMKC